MMKTLHLQLVSDEKIPRFKRLEFTETEITFSEAMEKGIHIRHNDTEHLEVISHFQKAITQSDYELDEIASLGYADNIEPHMYRGIYSSVSILELLLNWLKDTVYFVESLSYQELFSTAQQQLKQNWSHKTAEEILKARFDHFDDLRQFLKSKNPELKLQGYGDLQLQDLSEVLSPDDFKDTEKLVIQFGLECHTFHHVDCLNNMVNEDGLLRSLLRNKEFYVIYMPGNYNERKVVPYHCTHQDGTVHCIPGLNTIPEQRQTARDIADRWRTDDGKYCFQTSLHQVEKMLGLEEFHVTFHGSTHHDNYRTTPLLARVKRDEVKRFCIGELLTVLSTNTEIKEPLKEHGMSLSGRKEALLERLIQLCTEQYGKHEPELTAYFSGNRYIRISREKITFDRDVIYRDEILQIQFETFPLLQDHALRNQLLAMYALRHLRGNVILDGTYCNDSCSISETARGLIQQDVNVDYAFLAVM